MRLLLATPWIAFILLALVAPIRRSRTATRIVIGATVLGLLSGSALLAFGGEAELDFGRWLGATFPLEIRFRFVADSLACAMGATVGLVSSAILVYAFSYMGDESDSDYGRFFTEVFLFIGAMLGTVFAANLLPLYAFWEVMGLASYLLIGFHFERERARRAAVRAFWVTRFGDVGFLIAVIVAVWNFPTLDFAALNSAAPGLDETVRRAFLLLVLAGVAGKSAQFPLHIWLPDAMEGPTPVSALVHAATMVAAGVFLLLRISPILGTDLLVSDIVLTIGVTTALLGAVQALFQRDLKQVLAMSTISQLGYMVAAVGAGAAGAALYHLLTHAFFKALLFLSAGAVAHVLGTLDLRRLRGLWQVDRLTTLALVVGSLALAGVAPLSGGLSKGGIIVGVFEHSTLAGSALLIGSVLTALYVGRILAIVVPGEPEGHGHANGAAVGIALSFLALGTAVLGLGQHSILSVMPGEIVEHPLWITIGETLLAIAGIAVGYMWGKGSGRDPAGSFADMARAGFGLPAIHHEVYASAILPLGRLLGWFDRYIVDGLVNATAAGVVRAARPFRRVDGGSLSTVLAAILMGWLLLWAVIR